MTSSRKRRFLLLLGSGEVGAYEIPDLEINDWIAGLSALAAILAAAFAFSSARQAKRQADAVLGDVEPVFSAYQLPDDGKNYRHRVAIEIVNHNRLPLYVQSIRLEYPDWVLIHRGAEEVRDLVAALYDVVIEKKREHVFDVPFRLAGRFSSDMPAVSTSIFNVRFLDQNQQGGFVLGFIVRYRMHGSKQVRVAFASTGFDVLD
ncbi:hypothetical protein ACQEDT_03765 [Agrobacterium pusense]|uniref:hypothetical protein n=1 Tax=Agrobacterium pusense TaxID=648995 RepID=UPI003D134521